MDAFQSISPGTYRSHIFVTEWAAPPQPIELEETEVDRMVLWSELVPGLDAVAGG